MEKSEMRSPTKTTITITHETKERLNERKCHPRQAYEEIILDLLEKTKQQEGKK